MWVSRSDFVPATFPHLARLDANATLKDQITHRSIDGFFNALAQMFIILYEIELQIQEIKPNIDVESHYLFIVFSILSVNHRENNYKHISDLIQMGITHLSKSQFLWITKLLSSNHVGFKMIIVKSEE